MAETFETLQDTELCGDDIGFQDRVLEVPRGLQDQISRIHSEITDAHREHLHNVLDNYIRSTIHISSGNERLDTFIFAEILNNMLIGMYESGFSLDALDLQEGRNVFLRSALQRFSHELPEEYRNYYAEGNLSLEFGEDTLSLLSFAPFPQLQEETHLDSSPEETFSSEVEQILGVHIHGREDVNNTDILKKLELMIATSNDDFTQEDAEDILKQAFTLAFQREMTGVMRSQTRYMGENIDVWQEAFSRRLTEVSDPRLQEVLLFLPFVESNLNPRAQSDAGAIGLWQITLPTAQRNSGGFTLTSEGLQDPLVSAKVAARYLNQIIGNLKKDFPDLDEEAIVMMALREYNGAWSGRLKEEYRANTFGAILQIFVQIDILQSVYADPRLSDEEKAEEMMRYIAYIENTYFESHGLSEYVQSKGFDTPDELLEWSENYLKKIILQQCMYPYQVFGAYEAYQNIQNTL